MKSNDTPALHGWRHLGSGRESELYIPAGSTRYDAETILLISTNRIDPQLHPLLRQQLGASEPSRLSPNAVSIPGKAVVTNQLTLWWFEQLADLGIPTHFLSGNQVPEHVAGRAILGARLDMYPVVAKIFGYVTAELLDYLPNSTRAQTDQNCAGQTGEPAGGRGCSAPGELTDTLYWAHDRAGLQHLAKQLGPVSLGAKLPQPLCLLIPRIGFGRHQNYLSKAHLTQVIGAERIRTIEKYSRQLYQRAAEIAQAQSVVLAQADFEYGDGLGYGGPLVVAGGGHLLSSGAAVYWKMDSATGTEPIPSAYSVEREAIESWLWTHWQSLTPEGSGSLAGGEPSVAEPSAGNLSAGLSVASGPQQGHQAEPQIRVPSQIIARTTTDFQVLYETLTHRTINF